MSSYSRIASYPFWAGRIVIFLSLILGTSSLQADLLSTTTQLVAEAMKRPFKHSVRVVRLSPARLQALIMQQMRQSLSPGKPVVPPRYQIWARYSPSKQVLYLATPGPTYDQAVQRLILAHELVHAHDDQYFGLQRLMSRCTSTPQRLACLAVLEGHAVWVTQQLAHKQHYRTSQWRQAQDLVAPRQASPSYDLVYRQGPAFISACYQRGGLALVRQALQTPPVLPHIVRHPERYPPPDLRPCLTRLKPQLVGWHWRCSPLHLADLAKGLARGLAPAAITSALQGYWSGAKCVATRQGALLGIGLVRFAEPRTAARFYHADLQVMQALWRNWRQAALLQPLSGGWQPLPASTKSQNGGWAAFQLQCGTRQVDNFLLLWQHGPYLVEINALNVPHARSQALACLQAMRKTLALDNKRHNAKSRTDNALASQEIVEKPQ